MEVWTKHAMLHRIISYPNKISRVFSLPKFKKFIKSIRGVINAGNMPTSILNGFNRLIIRIDVNDTCKTAHCKRIRVEWEKDISKHAMMNIGNNVIVNSHANFAKM